MPMYNLIEYSDSHAKALTRLWQYHKFVPYENITDSESFKFKTKMT